MIVKLLVSHELVCVSACWILFEAEINVLVVFHLTSIFFFFLFFSFFFSALDVFFCFCFLAFFFGLVMFFFLPHVIIRKEPLNLV